MVARLGTIALVAVGLFVGLPACSAGAPPYAQCGGEIACATGRCTDLRYTRLDGSEGGGTFCTDDCVDDADCMALDGSTDAACVTLDRASPTRYFCAARCEAAEDCYAGTACTDTDDPVIGRICLP